jgi:ABC-type oligopeptide transport system substrate-binding subunit/class 3 adenylate cyclase
MREERKVVTVLFADLVGSTALAETLDPEDVKLVVGDAVARMVGEIEALGGHVKDLAGDGVLAFFGAPRSYEDDAERAVRAALRTVAEVSAFGAEVARGFGVEGLAARVAVTTGQVVLGPVGGGTRVEYGAYGDVVNVAARLETAAAPGTVLVDAATRKLVEPMFAWAESRTLELKGKEAPVAAHVVSAALPVTGKVRGLEGMQVAVVGRDAELAQLREAAEALRGGSGGILFLTGEAGIGKSRLMLELRELLDDSAVWLEGRCVSYGESLPYWPFRDLFRDWLQVGPNDPELRVRIALRRASEGLFGERAAETYPYLGALLGLTLEPDAAARLAELSPEALQYRTFEVMRELFELLASTGPVALVLDDLHWADPTSVQLTETLLGVVEEVPVLLVIAQRPEHDHSSWQLKELAQREFPHATHEIALAPLSGNTERELLDALVGEGTLPNELEHRLLDAAEGNPFFLEELVRSLVDAGALVRDGSWRFDHEVDVEVPATVEKVILARLDRLAPQAHDVLTAASALGRRFGLQLLEGVVGGDGEVRDALHELQRLDLVRAGRRWPQPEYRFKHALIQETAYRTLLAEPRALLHRRAAEWLESQQEGDETLGLLAHHWLAAHDEDKAISYLTRAGDKARQEYALDEAVGHYQELLPLLEQRGERQEIALVLFKLALALHSSMRFEEANDAYQRAFGHWTPPPARPHEPQTTLRVAATYLPNDPDPKSAIAWPNIQLCMQLFDRLVEAWPERTLVPSLAERWEIAPDGLRYVFHLREGLRWSDGQSLTAHDVEFGIKRVLDPGDPGASVSIYFVLENGEDYYLRRSDDADRIGVHALDDRTVEFRLVAPAPYFMSVMNRPDSGPQPRHAIEEHRERWTEPSLQVVSGPFRQTAREAETLVLERNGAYTGARQGNIARIEFVRSDVSASLEAYARDEVDVVAARYTPRLADVMPKLSAEVELGPAAWTGYLSFDHSHPVVSNVDIRRALAHAIDREALGHVVAGNLIVATGGLVPPALQGHTPEIAPRFDPELARACLAAGGSPRDIAVAALEAWEPIIGLIADMWRETLGLAVGVRWWSNEEAMRLTKPWHLAPVAIGGWLPGYPDPEYYLRLELHSSSLTNEGGFAYAPFDELIERARQERSDRARLELFHAADRMAIADRVALIPLVYGRSMAFVKPYVRGWWEFGKTSASFADLSVER